MPRNGVLFSAKQHVYVPRKLVNRVSSHLADDGKPTETITDEEKKEIDRLVEIAKSNANELKRKMFDRSEDTKKDESNGTKDPKKQKRPIRLSL